MKGQVKNQIAYRCPDCGMATVGFLGGLTAVSDMLRLKCGCGNSALDIRGQRDGLIHFSAPCVYCKDSHGFNIGKDMVFSEQTIKLPCPYSGMDILFIGNEDSIAGELSRSAEELTRIMMSLEAKELSDIQPKDIGEGECPPDPAIYDTLNLVVKDLVADGGIKCPCSDGEYDLRFCDEGMQVYCTKCGATYTFYAKSVSLAEEYLTIDSIELK